MNTADRARELGIKVGDEVAITVIATVKDVYTHGVSTSKGLFEESDIRLVRRAPVTCPDFKAGYACRWDTTRACINCPHTDIRQPSAPVPPTADELAEALRKSLVCADGINYYGPKGVLDRWDAAKGKG